MGLCDHCGTIDCIFGANVYREKCEFYKPKTDKAGVVVFDRIPKNCGECVLCLQIKNIAAYCMATRLQIKYSETDMRDGMCPMVPIEDLIKKEG